jgi:hypothetical protein
MLKKRCDIFVQRCLKNDESNESNILFYPYICVEDKHNCTTGMHEDEGRKDVIDVL